MEFKLKINGKQKIFDEDKRPGSLLELIEMLGIDEATVVAEVDGDIVVRSDFAETAMKDGQSVELVRFVGGG
jgi:thiamine biosynthesis protein ThiS